MEVPGDAGDALYIARWKERIMKAYVLNEPGGVENLVLSEIEKPAIKADEVLVETKAISINPVDVKVRPVGEFLTRILGTKDRPVILGWDISGTVVAVGKEVRGFEFGDKVFGMVNFPGHGKAYAEYVASPASHLAVMPGKVTFEKAAATTLAALTGLHQGGSTRLIRHTCNSRMCSLTRPLGFPRANKHLDICLFF